MKKLKKRIFSLVLVTTLVLAMVPSSVLARTVDDIKKAQQQLEEKQEEIKTQIDELKGETANAQEYKAKLEEQITVAQEQVDTARADIKTLDQSIKELTAKINKAQEGYEETIKTFKKRVKALYVGGEASTLEILLSSKSLHNYSMRMEFLNSVAKHDKDVVEKLTQLLKATEKEREQLKQEKAQQAELKKTLEGKTKDLSVLEEEQAGVIQELKNDTASAETDLEDSFAYGDDLAYQMSAEIERMKAAATPKPTPKPTPEPTPEPTPTPIPDEPAGDEPAGDEPAGDEPAGDEPAGDEPAGDEPAGDEPTQDEPEDDGENSGSANFGFMWPCPGYIMITSSWGDGRDHKGLDLAANYGTPIYAAESGTVMIANSTDSWGYSWGYYVSIYHNETYSTLYAHCSSIAVSAGQYVEKGQVIGYVGSTGNSSGNHLHFEVYQNGTRIDPMQFF